MSVFLPPEYIRMSAVGVNISDHGVKFVELVPKKDAYILGKWGEIELPSGVISEGEIVNGEKFEKILKILKDKYEIGFVNVSIPEEKTYLFTIKIPQIPEKDIKEALGLQIQEHVPLAQNEVVFDYEIVSTQKKKEIELVVSVVSKKISESLLNMFLSSGLIPLSFEMEAQSIKRAILPVYSRGAYIIVDIGRTRTGIFIVSGGAIRYTATVEIGGNLLTSAISRDKGISFEEADKIKKYEGFSKEHSALVNTMSAIHDEIKKRKDFFESHSEDVKEIKSILICGGNASIPGLAEYLEESIGIEAKTANVWRNVFSIDKYVPDMNKGTALGYASAIGLALK